MALDRFSYVPQQNFVDTYIPMPFQEMKEAVNAKQQEYDTQQNLLNTADKSIKGVLPTVSDTYKDTKGNDVINPHAQKLNYYNNILDQKKQEIFDKYKNDLTSSEAKSEISNFARSAANIYNEVVPDAINTEAAYKESKKRLDERKGTDGGYRLLDFDRSLYNLTEGKTNRLDTSNIADEHKFEDLDKNFLEGFKADVTDKVGTYINQGLLAKVDFGKKVKELTEKEIAQRYDSFYRTNHLPIVEKSADYDIEHIYQKYKASDPTMTREQFNKNKSIKLQDGKSYTPEQYKDLLIKDDKQRRLDQAKRYAFKEEDKSQSSSFLPGIDFSKKAEESDNVGYIPTSPIGTDLVNNKYNTDNIKEMTFKDYLSATGESKSIVDKYDFDYETQKRFKTSYTPSLSEKLALDKQKQGKPLTADDRKRISNYNEGIEEHTRKNNIYKQYQVLKDIDKLSDTDFNKKMSEVNPVYKAVFNQNPDLSKKDILTRVKELENKKNISGVAINLREKEADNQWYSLFGKKDEGSFNSAKALSWTDRDTGEKLNFDSIEIDGTPIKDLSPDEIIKYKKEGRIGIPKFEYPIASKGGQSVEIDGKTYVTGGETFKEKAELSPMASVNSVLRNPLQTANSNGLGERYTFKPKESDPYLEKQYGFTPSAIQGYTDYKTLQNYVIIYDGNKIIGKLPLDEYNKGIIDAVGGGFVQPEKIKGPDYQ